MELVIGTITNIDCIIFACYSLDFTFRNNFKCCKDNKEKMIGTPEEILKKLSSLNPKKLYEIKPYRLKRGNRANSYLWVLCKKIADVVGNTKEDVYKDLIKRVGTFEIISINSEAVGKFIESWQLRGLGWLAERTGCFDGSYEEVVVYYGSSSYNSKEMWILINELINEAQELDIDTTLENKWRKNNDIRIDRSSQLEKG
mgnify:CR=1 FL=1